MKAYTKIQSIPVRREQELLLYMIQNQIKESIILYTTSGNRYEGIPVHLSEDEVHAKRVITILTVPYNGRIGSVIYLNTNCIEAVEFPENDYLIDILSLGKVFSKEYGTSGKLEVLRDFKLFNEAITSKSGLKFEGPVFENLPEEKQQLDRIRQISKTIQNTLTDIVSEKDAKQSWEEKIKKVIFTDKQRLDVVIEEATLIIGFPFSNTHVPETSTNEFSDAVLAVL